MCDDATERDSEAFLLSRRELGKIAGAAVAGLVTGCASTSSPASAPSSGEPAASASTRVSPATKKAVPTAQGRIVAIDTPDGTAEAFFVAPETGKHPAVLVWPDVAGLRRAYETMATRLAGEGYAVLTVNPYYRSSKLPVLETFADWRTDEGRARIAPMREALTPEAITRDAAAYVGWLTGEPHVDTRRKLGTTGYCMGGPFTFRTAAAAPERVGVIVSLHGGGLVTSEPTSPHRLLAGLGGKVAALILIAQNDDEREPTAKSELRAAAAAAGVAAEIEVYPAQHGWCTIDAPIYDEAQAERAFARTLATFEEHL